MEFKVYDKIRQFKDIVRNIRFLANHKGIDENGEPLVEGSLKPTIEFTGTIKLHGTNAGICYTPIKGIIAQKRSTLLAVDSSPGTHFEFNRFVQHTQKEYLTELLVDIYKENNCTNHQITLYGEWAGKSIQKGVGISLLDKSFYIFDCLIYNFETKEKTWIDISELEVDSESNVFNIYDFPTFKVNIDFNNPGLIQNQLVEITTKVEQDCPVSRQLLGDIEDKLVGEGVVWTAYWKNQKHIFKVKGEKHSTSKVKKLASVDPELIKSVLEFVDYAATENRIQQGIKEVNATEKKDMPALLRWVANDIITEENDTLTTNSLQWRDVQREVSNRVRQYYFKTLNTL